MSRTHLYRTDAIILRRSDFGEADRLLTVFTPQYGKIRLVAKGVRKTTSRKSGHVELFMLTDILVAKARNLDIISQAEVVETYRDLREDLERTSYAYYLAELVDGFTEEGDVNKPLFELLAFTLAYLSHSDDPFLVLRYFELHLLSLLGLQPQLHFCVGCQQPLDAVDSYFSFSEGGVLCSNCGVNRPKAVGLPLTILKVLRYIQTHPWEKVSGLQLSPPTRQQSEALLLGYLTFLLERRLKSVDFVHKLRKMAR